MQLHLPNGDLNVFWGHFFSKWIDLPCLSLSRGLCRWGVGILKPPRRGDFTVYLRSQTEYPPPARPGAGVYQADKINVIKKHIYFSVNRVILAICAFYPSTWSNCRGKNSKIVSHSACLCLFLHIGVIIELGLWYWWLLWYLWFPWHAWESLWVQNLSQGPCFITHVSLPVL